MKIFVFGGVSASADPELIHLAERTGSAIAVAGHTMLCGGRADGVMGAAVESAITEDGPVIAILDRSMLSQERLHRGIKNVQSFDTTEQRRAYVNQEADAFIALPGGFGTLSELTDIISRRRDAEYGKPITLLGPDRFWHGMQVLVDSMYGTSLVSLKDRALFRYAKTPQQALVQPDPTVHGAA